MLKNTKKDKKDETIVQQDKGGNTDYKTDVKDLRNSLCGATFGK